MAAAAQEREGKSVAVERSTVLFSLAVDAVPVHGRRHYHRGNDSDEDCVKL